jgi:hypothetical protein
MEAIFVYDILIGANVDIENWLKNKEKGNKNETPSNQS